MGLPKRRLLSRRRVVTDRPKTSCSLSIICTKTALASSSIGFRPTSPKTITDCARFDGSPLYEHADARQGEHPDWGTMIFELRSQRSQNFFVANALFWLDKYHIDGLRVDAVASMLYLDYSREDGEWVPNRHGGRENLECDRLLA